MGYTNYSLKERDIKNKKSAEDLNVSFSVGNSGTASLDMSDTKVFNNTFKQQELACCHKDMLPLNMKNRECRDSAEHPNTIPIIVGLDVTGSMGNIPKDFVMDGLPTMMGTIIQRGSPDASVCFMAIGDHEYDKAPIQVGQFESGDAELDLWLTRSWLEGGGGGNNGESYGLTYYVAARHTVTDSYTKRGIKGFLFTVGDEPILPIYPASALKGIFGDNESLQSSIRVEDILKEAQESYHVYHIAISGNRGGDFWKQLLGDNYILCDNYKDIPKLIAEIVNQYNTKAEDLPTWVTDESGPEKPNVIL